MNTEFVNSLPKFLPEILLCSMIFIITFEGILPKIKPAVLFYSVITGLAIILIFTLAQSSVPSQKLFFDMLATDPFSVFLKMLICISALFAICYSAISHETSSHNKNSAEYYILISGLTLGGFLLVSSINLLMVYISIELINICSYLLSGFIKESKRASESSLKYALSAGIASALMLFGISIVFGLCGTTDLYFIGNFLSANSVNSLTLLVSVLLILAGLCFKMTVFPSYFISDNIYENSSLPVTALLTVSGVISGFGIFARFFLTAFHNSGFKWEPAISIIAVITITITGFAALWQDNIKRLLAFLTFSQAGIIILGLVSDNPAELTSSLYFLVVFLFSNMGIFFCIIIISNKYDAENIHSLKGLGSNSPVLAIIFCIFLLSLCGFPLTSGFVSRFFVMTSLFGNGYFWPVIFVSLNIILSLYCILKIIKNIFFLEPLSGSLKFGISNAEIYILLILLIPVLLFGIYFAPLINLAQFSAMMLGL